MSETPSTLNPSLRTTPSKFDRIKSLLVLVPYLVLYVIAIWLVAMTDSDPDRAAGLWQWFIAAIGVVATVGGWERMRAAGGITLYLVKQILHWGATLLVVHLLFWQTMQHFLTANTHGFVAVYVLGLAAILSGIHVDWKMGLFGIFLIGSGVGIVFFDDNAMLMALVGIAVVGIGSSLVIRRRTIN